MNFHSCFERVTVKCPTLNPEPEGSFGSTLAWGCQMFEHFIGTFPVAAPMPTELVAGPECSNKVQGNSMACLYMYLYVCVSVYT